MLYTRKCTRVLRKNCVFSFFFGTLRKIRVRRLSTIDLWLFKKIYALLPTDVSVLHISYYFFVVLFSLEGGGLWWLFFFFLVANAISSYKHADSRLLFCLRVTTKYRILFYFFFVHFCLFLLIYLSLCSACMCKKHRRKWFFSWLFRRFFYVLYTNIQVMQFISFFFPFSFEIRMPVRPTYLGIFLSANMEYISSLLFMSLCIYRVCPRSVTGSYILLAHVVRNVKNDFYY